jgi:hypothetical protein
MKKSDNRGMHRGLQRIINGEQNKIGCGRDWGRRDRENENIWGGGKKVRTMLPVTKHVL